MLIKTLCLNKNVQPFFKSTTTGIVHYVLLCPQT